MGSGAERRPAGRATAAREVRDCVSGANGAGRDGESRGPVVFIVSEEPALYGRVESPDDACSVARRTERARMRDAAGPSRPVAVDGE